MQKAHALPLDIRVYLVDAKEGITEEMRERLWQFMDEETRARILQKKLGNTDSLIADALRQYAIFDAFGIAPSQQKVRRTERGKPYLEGYRDVFFNYSHSGGVILLAAARREIGVDVQEIKPYTDSAAKRLFTEEERTWLASEQDKEEAFFRLWTKHEAAAKLYGTGLFHPHPDEGFYYTERYKQYMLTFAWL